MLIARCLVRCCDTVCATVELCMSIAIHVAAKNLYAVCCGALRRARATVLGKVGRGVTKVGISAIFGSGEKVNDRPLATTNIASNATAKPISSPS
jgi:hypothetical protein